MSGGRVRDAEQIVDVVPDVRRADSPVAGLALADVEQHHAADGLVGLTGLHREGEPVTTVEMEAADDGRQRT